MKGKQIYRFLNKPLSMIQGQEAHQRYIPRTDEWAPDCIKRKSHLAA